MKLRPILFWCHLCGGILAGIVILVMSVTGVLLVYERQLIEWSDRVYQSSPGARLPIDTLLRRFTEQIPAVDPSAVTLRADVDAPASIAAGNRAFYVDATTGRVLGEPSTGIRNAMSTLRAWHRWLALEGENRTIGKAISGWANGTFLFIVLSGMYLWIPRTFTWSKVKAVAIFRAGLRGKARDFNWHNVIGIWSAVPLAVVVATAMPISFPWANAFVYRVVGEEPPAARSAPAAASGVGARESRDAAGAVGRDRAEDSGLQPLWARAERQMPGWRSISLRLPTSASAPAVFTIDGGTGGQPQLRATLTLDSASGNLIRWEPFESQSRGRRLRSWTRFTHTGEYYGILGQTVAGLASAGGVVLVWTGLSLAWRRFTGRRIPAPGAVRGVPGADSEAA